jgi:nucleoside-diphosphate-sugar epimerase
MKPRAGTTDHSRLDTIVPVAATAIRRGRRVRVLVTGGTGRIGSHTVAALVNAGHDVRLLVRSPERIAPALEPLAVRELDSRLGDATQRESVERALEGCEALVHAAPVYSFDPRRQAIRDANIRGAGIVLGAAPRAGLARSVHVWSVVALPSRVASQANGRARWLGSRRHESLRQRFAKKGATASTTGPG